MAMFDPKKAKEDRPRYEGIPPNEYLIALRSFDRKTSKTGNEYLHCKFAVIHGAARGKTFYDNVSLNQSNKGAMYRLSCWAEGCGVEEAFDLDSDEAIRANLVDRPFKARLNRRTENGYVNNGIERYLNDKVTDADREAMNAYVAERAEAAEWGDSGGSADGGNFSDDVPPAGDDDIPF